MTLAHDTFEVDRLFSLILRMNLCSTTKTSTTTISTVHPNFRLLAPFHLPLQPKWGEHGGVYVGGLV